MIRKSLQILLMFVMVFSLSITAVAAENEVQSDLKVTLNGEQLLFDEPTYLVDGTLVVPYYKVIESIDAKIAWDGEQREVTVTKDENAFKFKIDSNVFSINGLSSKASTPITIKENRTYGPLNVLAEALGLSYELQQETKTVNLQSNDEPGFKIYGVNEGDAVQGDKLTVAVVAFNHELTDFRTNTAPVAGQGHIHLWLDTDVSDPMISNKLINTDPMSFSNLKPGDHTLTVQLVGNDHAPLQPDVKQVVHFTTGVPSVSIVSPTDSSNVNGTNVDVKLDIQNFKLADFRTNTKVVEGQGHVHVWLDQDTTDPMISYKLIEGDTVHYTDVTAGEHTLTVQLVNNDHTPIQPEVKQVIHFTTTTGPSVSIVSPTDSSNVNGTNVDVKLDIQNFKLADFRTNTKVVEGQGHVHVWLDQDTTDPLISYKLIEGDTVHYTDVAAGEHTLTVQLVNNDHTPIQPEVKQVIHFTTK